MNMTDEILNSWTDADECLAERIEKNTWKKLEITKTNSFSTYLGDDAEIVGYYNPFLNRVVMCINGTTIADIPANKALGISYLEGELHLPKRIVYMQANDLNTNLLFAKNGVNKYIALSNISDTIIPSGTTVQAQLEYTVFD